MALRRNVVIVDDEADSLGTASALLTAAGFEVSAASGTDEALQMIEHRPPDAVVFKILNPAGGVIDFVRRLGLNREARRMPVVMVTALNDFQLQSFLNGVPGVRKALHPPCSPDALRDMIAQLLPSAPG